MCVGFVGDLYSMDVSRGSFRLKYMGSVTVGSGGGGRGVG